RTFARRRGRGDPVADGGAVQLPRRPSPPARPARPCLRSQVEQHKSVKSRLIPRRFREKRHIRREKSANFFPPRPFPCPPAYPLLTSIVARVVASHFASRGNTTALGRLYQEQLCHRSVRP